MEKASFTQPQLIQFREMTEEAEFLYPLAKGRRGRDDVVSESAFTEQLHLLRIPRIARGRIFQTQVHYNVAVGCAVEEVQSLRHATHAWRLSEFEKKGKKST